MRLQRTGGHVAEKRRRRRQLPLVWEVGRPSRACADWLTAETASNTLMELMILILRDARGRTKSTECDLSVARHVKLKALKVFLRRNHRFKDCSRRPEESGLRTRK